MAPAPGPEPEPPEDLAHRHLPLRTFAAPVWYRGHKRKNPPLHFNAEQGRFCTSDGTLYLGADPRGAFLEAFAHQFGVAPGHYVVSQGLLESSCLCEVSARRPLQLVDLTTGPALRMLSATADRRIIVATHAVSQRWAHAFWHHPEQPDGILYPCRRAPELHSIALFARTRCALHATCQPNLLTDSTQVIAVLDHYGCALIP